MNATPNNTNPQLPRQRKWRWVAIALMSIGALGAYHGYQTNSVHFIFSWLLAFIFYLGLCLGPLFLLVIHHLFDSAWSAPLRRILEHLACLLFPGMLLLFLPIAILAHGLYPSFSTPLFLGASAFCFLSWGLVSRHLGYWSLRQDRNGLPLCTYKMRFWSAVGAILYAITITLASLFWIQALTPDWNSTIYPIWFFSASVWGSLAALYILTIFFRAKTSLHAVIRSTQSYDLAALLFAFTLFYAYIAYSQYFIIWNGNLPEETFWYALRGYGSWKTLSLILIIGHFVIPFIVLLPAKWKIRPSIMIPLCVWVLIMHFCDLQFQIMPVAHPDGFNFNFLWIDISCLLLMGGFLAEIFIRSYQEHPPCCLRDPRMTEALGSHPLPTTRISTAPEEPNEF